MLKVKRLGLDWGAAYTEATPMEIQSDFDEQTIQIYEAEGGGIVIELGYNNFNVFHANGQMSIKVIT